MIQWTPTRADLAWCAGLLRTVADGGVWGSTNGIYHVNHTDKRLTLTARPPWFNSTEHEKNVIAFGKLGYAVTIDED